MFTAYTAVLVALAGVVFLSFITGKRVWYFTNDTFDLGQLPFYAGIISNVGNLLWCATATVCFFTAAVIRRGRRGRNWMFFFFMSGVLTSLFLFDDLFQIHKMLYPVLFGLSTLLVCVAYGFFVLWYLFYFRKQIVETEFLMLGFSLAFFVFAIISDSFSFLPRGNTAFSDALKLFGIAGWLVYFSRTCGKAVVGSIGSLGR